MNYQLFIARKGNAAIRHSKLRKISHTKGIIRLFSDEMQVFSFKK